MPAFGDWSLIADRQLAADVVEKVPLAVMSQTTSRSETLAFGNVGSAFVIGVARSPTFRPTSSNFFSLSRLLAVPSFLFRRGGGCTLPDFLEFGEDPFLRSRSRADASLAGYAKEGHEAFDRPAC